MEIRIPFNQNSLLKRKYGTLKNNAVLYIRLFYMSKIKQYQ